MSTNKEPKYQFVNDILQFESFNNEVTLKDLKELDSIANKVKLKHRIDDLICGEIVNKSENLAALHANYRSNHTINRDLNSLDESEIKVEEFLNTICSYCEGKNFNSINIINLGIGGSFEGPKLY